MSNNRVTRILEDAKLYIKKHGWVQGDFGDHGRERCLLGALNSASRLSAGSGGSYFEKDIAVNRVRKVIGYSSIAVWNDQPKRTKDEVLDALDKAIAVQ